MKNLCEKCGKCCEYLMLKLSPQTLKKEYIRWDTRDGGNYTSDIYLIYPMLKYKFFDKKVKSHIYQCIHFKRDKNGKGKCVIHDIRPSMCSNFPSYNKISMYLDRNPSQYIGCGYNIDKTIGEK